MKVGILSYNINAPDFNYGAMLHSWAFQKYLSRYADLEIEIIDYMTPKVEGWNRHNPILSRINFSGKRIMKGRKYYLNRLHKFDKFIQDNLHVSKERYVQKSIANAKLPYDVMICESDVIWDTSRKSFDPVFFLATPSMVGKRKIAYSPSMGEAHFGTRNLNKLDVLLKNIHFISCRESYEKSVLEQHTRKNVQHVVDPVMLLDSEDYEAITGKRMMQNRYIFMYLPVNDNDTLRLEAHKYAKKHDLKILEISTDLRKTNNDIEICIPDAGIEEFLSAIRYADVVFTNSFHAICFSLIFGVQVYVFTRKYNGKIKDICSRFGLEKYYMADDCFEEREPYDVQKMQSVLSELRMEGRKWIDDALFSSVCEDECLDVYTSPEVMSCFQNTNDLYQLINKTYGKMKRKTNKIFSIVKKIYRAVINRLIRAFVGVRSNTIVVMTIADSYSCNPKYICEEIIRQNLPYDITWLIDNNTDVSVFPKQIKLINKRSISAAKAVYSAKLWLNNGICFSDYYDKKKNQKYIQTMHGSLGIKRLDNSIISRSKTLHGRKVICRECNNTDYLLVNSRFEEDVFGTSFWKNTKMLRIGHARTDILFKEDYPKNKIRRILEEEYQIPINKRIVLYAPTHRKDLKQEDLYINYEGLIESLNEKFGGEFVVLLRHHNKSEQLFDTVIQSEIFGGLIFDVTKYPDIQELMVVTDVGITDYSSWIYDFVITKKPGFIYATDLEKYNHITGLYYPLEETPFGVSHTNDELMQVIEEFDPEVYCAKVEKFLREKDAMDDGKSAQRAVELIKRILQDG